MKDHANESVVDLADSLGRRITVMVGYSWGRDGEGPRLVLPRNDSRWRAIKTKVESEAKAVKTYATNRMPAAHKVEISIERLRGTHGDMLLSNLLGRIRKADILIFDIGSATNLGYNSNVLLEVGMALSLDRHRQGRLFILKPEDLGVPSDLSGFLFTDYVSNGREFKISDDPGFRAALRSSLMELARARGMIGDPRSNAVEVESDGESATKIHKPVVKQRRASRKM